ncbi:hypothetical protein [Mycobacterium sp.]|uniref:hypothetical protein n=1 Tax=Mycobacterium sp. TaxID=1785 RepID=UPI003C789800
MRREAEIWRLHLQGMSVREIESALGCPRTTVHRAIKKRRKLAEAMATGEPGNVVAVMTDDEMMAEDVQTAEDIERLNELELHRLRYYPADSPQQRALAEARERGWRSPSRPEPTVYPVSDGHSWRVGCDAAMSDDSGVDADDW